MYVDTHALAYALGDWNRAETEMQASTVTLGGKMPMYQALRLLDKEQQLRLGDVLRERERREKERPRRIAPVQMQEHKRVSGLEEFKRVYNRG